MIDKIRNFDGHIIFTQHTHSIEFLDTIFGENLPPDNCTINTTGWKIHKDLQPYVNQSIIKHSFGSLQLIEYIKNINSLKSITMIGLCTDICVLSNALLLKSAYSNYKIIVDSNYCKGTTIYNHNNAIKVMKQCHIIIK